MKIINFRPHLFLILFLLPVQVFAGDSSRFALAPTTGISLSTKTENMMEKYVDVDGQASAEEILDSTVHFE